MKKHCMLRKVLMIIPVMLFSLNAFVSAEPTIQCSWGCRVRGGLTDEFLEQIKAEGELSKRPLTLGDVSDADLQQLKHLKDELRQLVIQAPNSITDITPLSELTNLTSLELTVEDMTDYSPISSLKNLTSVVIKFGNCANVDFLRPLEKLETVGLACIIEDGADLSGLAGKSSLKHVWLSSSHISELSFLKDAVQLEGLQVEFPMFEESALEDISAIAAFPQLKTLMLDSIPATDLSALEGLCNLTHLSLKETAFADYTPLGTCEKPNMQTLWLTDSAFDRLEVIQAMPKLESLYIERTKVQNWDTLKTATTLTTLHAAETSFSDLRLLEDMQRLEVLSISGNRVTHPEILAALPKLRTLMIAHTQGISDLTILKTVPMLKSLSIAKGQFPEEQITALQAEKPDLRISQMD